MKTFFFSFGSSARRSEKENIRGNFLRPRPAKSLFMFAIEFFCYKFTVGEFPSRSQAVYDFNYLIWINGSLKVRSASIKDKRPAVRRGRKVKFTSRLFRRENNQTNWSERIFTLLYYAFLCSNQFYNKLTANIRIEAQQVNEIVNRPKHEPNGR